MNWIPPKTLICADEKTAQLHLDDILHALNEAGHKTSTKLLNENQKLADFLRAIICISPYLRNCMVQYPAIIDEILTNGFEQTCSTVLGDTPLLGLSRTNEAELMQTLRINKISIALSCALADLGGWWNGEKVTRTLAQFADASLHAAFDFILFDASQKKLFELANTMTPQKNSGLICLAMGKHGAYELNYSSDIDLILFYDEQAAERVRKTDPTTFFARVARQLVKLLQERTSDGYVFRVDLRLRPDPASTPAIMPLEAALIYYESYGQNWERAALIKARAAAGDIVAGENLIRELSPFIWRKYLDYAAIQDVHSIKRQIHAHKGHATIATKGHNIKLGRGGIREIEFFAQTQQLIAGGRLPQLRTLRTIDTLNALCEYDWIDQKVVDELTRAYWFLRDVEHRLQMVRDEQTHTLPTDENDFANIALMMGYTSAGEFETELTTVLRIVEDHYASLFESAEQLTASTGNLVFTGDEEDPQTIENLVDMGYKRPSDIVRIIKGWHFGRYPALRTSQARELLTELTPNLLQEFAKTGRADETLIAMDRFIAGLPAGIQLFALLNSNPPLMHLLTLLLSAAPRLSDIITRKPHVFDGLLDPAFNTALPDRELLTQRLTQFLSKASDYESILNRARIFAAEQKFLTGVRLLNGTINSVQAGNAFSDLAEIMTIAMVDTVTIEFEKKHGLVEGGSICVLAMGRLGSRELTASSDLDLIFLYDLKSGVEYSNGGKPLHVSQFFTRLTQRLTAAMSAPTAEGVIYELDFRLRPSGNAGPLATQFQSFLKYQREQSWTWEKQALTRARPIAGEASLCARVDLEITKLIARENDATVLKTDISQMRYRIEKEKGSKNIWDCKNTAGGLIDIEFIAQWIVLQNAELPIPAGRNSHAIIQQEKGNGLSHADGDVLLLALELYTTILQILRSCLNDNYNPDDAPSGLNEILCQATGMPDVAAIRFQLRYLQEKTRDIFKRLLG